MTNFTVIIKIGTDEVFNRFSDILAHFIQGKKLIGDDCSFEEQLFSSLVALDSRLKKIELLGYDPLLV